MHNEYLLSYQLFNATYYQFSVIVTFATVYVCDKCVPKGLFFNDINCANCELLWHKHGLYYLTK